MLNLSVKDKKSEKTFPKQPQQNTNKLINKKPQQTQTSKQNKQKNPEKVQVNVFGK